MAALTVLERGMAFGRLGSPHAKVPSLLDVCARECDHRERILQSSM